MKQFIISLLFISSMFAQSGASIYDQNTNSSYELILSLNYNGQTGRFFWSNSKGETISSLNLSDYFAIQADIEALRQDIIALKQYKLEIGENWANGSTEKKLLETYILPDNTQNEGYSYYANAIGKEDFLLNSTVIANLQKQIDTLRTKLNAHLLGDTVVNYYPVYALGWNMSPVNFGTAVTSLDTTMTRYIKNTGNITLACSYSMAAINEGEVNPNPFSLVTDSCISITATDSQEIYIRFRPTVANYLYEWKVYVTHNGISDTRIIDSFDVNAIWIPSDVVPPIVTADYFVKLNYSDIYGTKDTVSTITEVNSLTSGDTIAFKSGEIFKDAVLNCRSGVTYLTYGGTEQAIIGDSTDTAKETFVKINSKSNVTLDNLKIYAGNYDQRYKPMAIQIYSSFFIADTINSANTKKNIVIKNCTIMGSYNSTIQLGDGIYAEGGINGLTIQNNYFAHFAKGIYISNPYNVLIDGNHFDSMYYAKPNATELPKNLRFTTNLTTRGGMAIELYGETWYHYNYGSGGCTNLGGCDSTLQWDSHYTTVISNNHFTNWETGCIEATTISRMIIEYNEANNMLDERIFHGAIDHPHGMGKLDDLWGGQSYYKYPGSIGTIIRYNYVHDVQRWQTSLKYSAHDGFRFTCYGQDYETDGSVYLYKSYAIDPAYSPYSLGSSIFSGSGAAMQVYGNLIVNCNKYVFSRGFSKNPVDFLTQTSLVNQFYNNTVWNCANDAQLTSLSDFSGAATVLSTDYATPIYVRNNIFWINNTSGSAIYVQKGVIWEGNNIFFQEAGADSVYQSVGYSDVNNRIDPPVGLYLSSYGGTRKNIGTPSIFGVSLSDSSSYFVDPANRDYRLKSGSPAINAGISVGNNWREGTAIRPRGYVTGTQDCGYAEYGYTP